MQVDPEKSRSVELAFVGGEASSAHAALFPGKATMAADACAMIIAECEKNKDMEFFHPECQYSNNWVTKKENKNKKPLKR